MLNSYDLAKILGYTPDHCREIINKIKQKYGLTHREKCISINNCSEYFNITQEVIWECLEKRK